MLAKSAVLSLSLLAAAAQDPSPDASFPASATAPASASQPADLNAQPVPPAAAPPVSTSRAFTTLTFAKDYNAGTKDANGQLMVGTETIRLLTHHGKLFAGLDAWMDQPYGQQVLRWQLGSCNRRPGCCHMRRWCLWLLLRWPVGHLPAKA